MTTHDYGTCGYPLSSGKPCPAKARLTPQGLRCGKHSPEGIRRAQEAVQARREAKEKEREARYAKAEAGARIIKVALLWEDNPPAHDGDLVDAVRRYVALCAEQDG